VNTKLADLLTTIVTEAVTTIHKPGKQLDLFMIEVMAIQQNTECDSRLVKGLVVDHGARHPGMPRALKNAYILTCNVSLEKVGTFFLLFFYSTFFLLFVCFFVYIFVY
jgi:T-complex protein 1 subunit zeta